MNHHIAIIGGGITGLATAYYLQQEIEKRGLPLHYTLVESSHRWGGKIDTLRTNGYVIERGPDSFLARKKDATQLCYDLGLKEELVRNHVGQAYIYYNECLHPIPQGSVMGVPTNLEAFLQSQLLSTEGKARALEDLLLRPELKQKDQSVGEFFRRRFGEEMVERLIEPLVSGVYGSSIDHLSLEATYPQYQELLLKYGSLIKAFRKLPLTTSHQGVFQTLKSGLQTMVERIIQRLPAEALMSGQELRKLIKTMDGYELIFDHGPKMVAQSVVLTTPYLVTKRILHPYLKIMPLKHTEPTSVATVALAYAEEGLDISFEGTGFIVPKGSPYQLTACTWVHKKWPHTTPEGKALLRCFVGRPGEDEVVDGSDEEIAGMVLRDLQRLQVIRLKKDPELIVVHRMKKARPAYGVGHQRWVKKVFEQVDRKLPQVYLAGSYYQGIGLPDCIRQGKEVAERVVHAWMMKRKMVVRSMMESTRLEG